MDSDYTYKEETQAAIWHYNDHLKGHMLFREATSADKNFLVLQNVQGENLKIEGLLGVSEYLGMRKDEGGQYV